MFTPIEKISNLQEFKKNIFNGKIFVFQKSKTSNELVTQIKKKVQVIYEGELEKIHYLKNSEDISKDIVSKLKNHETFRKLFTNFLNEIGYNKGGTFWDRFVVRVAPAENNLPYREASRINIHRDTWGTNLYQQINWWAPVSNVEEKNTMIFYPDYFDVPVKNTTSTWDLNIYLANRKKGDFSYPSAPQLKEDLPSNINKIPVTIKPGEILCFSGAHLHSSSKEKSENTRISFEIRTICDNDLNSSAQAPNVDCDLQWKFPKIFKKINDNSPLKITS